MTADDEQPTDSTASPLPDDAKPTAESIDDDDADDVPAGLRDQIAIAAMKSLIEGAGGPKITTAKDVGRHAYDLADAMLAAR